MNRLAGSLLILGGVFFVISSHVQGFLVTRQIEEWPESCDSEIYCYGPLLHTVQMAHLFNDSKTFVDMKLKQNPDVTLQLFRDFMAIHNNEPTREQIRNFVDENFEKEGSEFEPWTPTDWHQNPKFLDNIRDAKLKEFGRELNDLWLKLGRKMTKQVEEEPDKYSIIHVHNPVIVPGGRFREFYYWDSYWIIKGLLYSEMYLTVKGMLSNFLEIISRFGFIPNGGRVYYSQRSQPPLLAGMIKAYLEFTNDEEFAIQAVPLLEHEFNFWFNNHTVQCMGHTVCTYGDKSKGPRPESYREDVISAEEFPTEEEKQEHYSELKAGAESGMDFSSRWFIDDKGENGGDLRNLKTRSIVPVELNAILFWNAKIIAEFYALGRNLTKAAEFEARATQIANAIHACHWHEDLGIWLDYDLINARRRNFFVPTNLAPLWMKAYNTAQEDHITDKVLRYIESENLDSYPGGVPNTLQNTGEQWDFPNVWAPMQYMLIAGLDGLSDQRAKDLARSWATRWVHSNYIVFNDTHAMFEKYNAEEMGGHGGGGEYEVQIGFGWSNGVIIELLNKYGDILSAPGSSSDGLKPFSALIVAIVALFGTLSSRIFG
ncbi:trehalase isoform X1 [Lutzomyia longipalpis]|uniref:Trehalase n=1 Tax=Lutzomyia longipalpis TaxID=7200 RepID=A0A7G3ARG4_LUTLO|nr:trehalase isoform X1 [Lutzomyia longipalpis]XP_055694078.1 trehalase isoform X1 [Lutzomyia longipalpis]XP_055694079.1 trehalase isoform X1 [Lutzomyia longipalpis]XP_055694080.1 trehalase isoform X1 [Lutzomyia longipalpis]XP_055694081.1 trehalase isoform X1 [Lutzomyia longipalpis]XP_055694082.1 trehalase isoform X1 [Lutzomyia longipalpis]XP_055694083.1 trehalase isoform X1 [Lutzomyia longipalpis]XP_055694084.1 trehalase isoform X1 [Lutzomyia longipalpis]XP_055694085.1 trehalase isoform X1